MGVKNHFYGKKHKPETIAQYFIGNKSRTGKPHTSETRKKMSISQKGRVITKETRIKISAANTGKKRSIEVKHKLSLTKEGRINPNATIYVIKTPSGSIVNISGHFELEKYLTNNNVAFYSFLKKKNLNGFELMESIKINHRKQ